MTYIKWQGAYGKPRSISFQLQEKAFWEKKSRFKIFGSSEFC